MKYNYKLLLTLGTSFALMTQFPAFGQNQGNGNGNGKDKSSEKDKKHHKNGHNASSQQANNAAHASSANAEAHAHNHRNNSTALVNKTQVNTARVNSAQVNTAQVSRHAANVEQPYYNTANQQRYNHASTQQRYNNAQQNNQNYQNQQGYNRSNHYGGYWYPADSHPNWNHNHQCQYNNQNCRWYDGGWLIITTAFTPQYPNGYTANGGSTVSRVQVQLANQGYYHGAIDGDFGPGTSNAIAGYQSDHGLYVTGQINNALLQSLQVL